MMSEIWALFRGNLIFVVSAIPDSSCNDHDR
jgi:hypothetical protein